MDPVSAFEVRAGVLIAHRGSMRSAQRATRYGINSKPSVKIVSFRSRTRNV